MATKKITIRQNFTRKNKKVKNPSLRFLNAGFSLYASKKYRGDKILEYTKNAEKKSNDKCSMDSSSWFGELDVAKIYSKKDTHIYHWKIKSPTYLLNINKKNHTFIHNIFKNTKAKLISTISLTDNQLKKIDYEHPYINMKTNDKALYEFKFAFGYLTVDEQYDFLKLVKYLIQNKFIELNTRDGESILKKIDFKINYYRISSFITKKPKYNRLSFYSFDKYAIMNLCKISHGIKGNIISGVYQKNDTSFWFPDLIVYKMNIQEYILFNPHRNLIYDEEIN